ncbi:hypothetical protein ZHAS_00007247 [Anopheles sinensis]|uniref:Uncharacterized protein n=1 Tax=Anopheles sinensis TaxID=74873 RepID=A0A084VPH9_ANOSI|nr:hypothetical protein ZHAS_00007247 [Anopheles sinensis]
MVLSKVRSWAAAREHRERDRDRDRDREDNNNSVKRELLRTPSPQPRCKFVLPSSSNNVSSGGDGGFLSHQRHTVTHFLRPR